MFTFIVSLAISFALRSTAYKMGKKLGLLILKRKARKAFARISQRLIPEYFNA